MKLNCENETMNYEKMEKNTIDSVCYSVPSTITKQND